MARYEDLSRYAYVTGSVPEGVEALNVGWLDEDDAYPQGEVPEGFLDALGVLCRDEPRMRMRGWQGCPLSHEEEVAYPVRIRVGDEDVALGSAEVRVVDTKGRWLIAPNLVHHYVEAHSYLPPEEFVEAVEAGRVAPSATE